MTTAATRTARQLTPAQQRRIDRARAELGKEAYGDPLEMAGRIGRLEYHLHELLTLAAELAERSGAA